MEKNQVTFWGKFLRKTGVDEIPQLINILKGEMTFVGPRPLMKADIDRLGWIEKKHLKRWSVKPGITGSAQLQNTCSADLSLANDLSYVRNKSLFLDLRIFMRSIFIPILEKTLAMKVLVNGIGNIGTTLLNLLSDYKGLLGIDVIFALKNTSIHSWKKTEIMFLKEKGIIICTKKRHR